MGLFKKLLGHEDETADPFGGASPAPASPAASTPIVSLESKPIEATWSSVMVNGKPVAPDQAQAFTQAFEQLGHLAAMGTSQVIDLRNVPGLRDKVLGAMSAHGNDAAALQGAVFQALESASEHLPPPAAAAGDPLDRLKELDALRKQGVLTDAEFAQQKKKLLDEL
jgi:uncharacterized Zn-binding protein involved in type VI secretion